MSESPANPLCIDANWHRSPLPAPDPANFENTLPAMLTGLADRHPDRDAIISGTQRTTYADLLGQAGALTHAILQAAAPAGPVALLLPSGVLYVAAWFACAAAGRQMLMVEQTNPPPRNAAFMEAAGVTLVLHDGSEAALAATGARAALVLPPLLPPLPLPSGGLGIGEPAFLFATSGTTGTPKLIVYNQLCVQTKVQCSAVVQGVRPHDVVMIAGSHSNLGVMLHALQFLICGGTLCLHDLLQDGLSGMFAAMLGQNVTQMRVTPSVFRTIAAMPGAAAALRQVTAVRFGGEPLLRSDADLVRKMCAPGCLVQNIYGSTESILFLWIGQTGALPDAEVMPNGHIYPIGEFILLDDDGQPSADDGEVVISSRFHALGDWLDGRIDGTRFPPDPRGDGRRLYYTGDLGRVTSDGMLAVLGRKNRLIKVNGQRVSLLEVEAVLQTMPGCLRAAVVPWQRGKATHLAAFLVAEPEATAMRDPAAWLAARLPRYMVPGRFETLPDLPVMPGGKLDEQALRARLGAAPAASAIAPSGPTAGLMRSLTEIWTEVLRISAALPDADFFALGGDSLKVIEVEALIEERLGCKLTTEALLQAPTIELLAKTVASHRGSAESQPRSVSGHRAKGRISLRKVRSAQGVSHGIVLGMPGWHGHAAPNGVVAANAWLDYDVWTCAADLHGGTMGKDLAWLACAREIADLLRYETWLRPRALFGYSMGGYLAWLVDRMLVQAGWAPTPIINFDCDPFHLRDKTSRAQIDALLPDGAGLPAARMLLLHRGDPGPFRVTERRPHEAWSALGANVEAVFYRTVDHDDMALAKIISAARETITAWTGYPGPASRSDTTRFDTLGGRLFEMLDSRTPPDASAVRSLVQDQPVPTDPTARAALLFLTVATTEPWFAVAYARRVIEARKGHYLATYAQAALLRSLGQADKAAELVETWSRTYNRDPALRDCLTRLPGPVGWGSMSDAVLSSPAALDIAIDMMRGHVQAGAS